MIPTEKEIAPKTEKQTVASRASRAAALVHTHDNAMKEIVEFMQADPRFKDGQSWNGSPYSYLQFVLSEWAVMELKKSDVV